MTISSTTRQAGPYAGNDVTTVFPFAFKVFAAGDLLVAETDDLGAQAVLTLTTDYSVSLNADQNAAPGGSVTRIGALPTGYELLITSDLAALQPMNLTNAGGFYPRVINDALDRLTILVQQERDKTNRALLSPIGEAGGVLPSVAARASKVLAFDANGAPYPIDAVSAGAAAAFDLSNVALSVKRDLLTSTTFAAGGSTPLTLIDRFTREIDVRDWGAIYDGRDNTAVIAAAAAYARTLPGTTRINEPSGDTLRSATLTLTHGQVLQGQGQDNTREKRTGDFGHSIACGIPASSGGDYGFRAGGVRGRCMYHDHGNGISAPTPGTWTNPVTGAWSHLRVYTPTRCHFDDLFLTQLPYQVWYSGGAACVWSNIFTISTNDPLYPAAQEGIANLRIDDDNGGHPINMRHLYGQFSGNYATGRAQTLSDGVTNITSVQCTGPLRNIWVLSGEALHFEAGLYAGAAREDTFLIEGTAGAVLLNIQLVGVFLDGSGNNMVHATTVNGVSAKDLIISSSTLAGQTFGNKGVRFDVAPDNGPSIVGCTIVGNTMTGVREGMIRLIGARQVTISANVARFWNVYANFTDDVKSAFCYVGQYCDEVTGDSNILGGTFDGSRTGHGCRLGMVAEGPQTSHVSWGDSNTGPLTVAMRRTVGGQPFAGANYGSLTVATLPATDVPPGSSAFATNGRSGAEGVGAGTGVPVTYRPAAGWVRYDNAVVLA